MIVMDRKRLKTIGAYLALILGLAQLVLVLLSWVLTAAMPDDNARSLLSAEGIRWFFGRFVSNMQSPILVWLILGSFAYGAIERSGILHYDSSEYRQRIAMCLALFECVLLVIVMLALTMVPHAILLNVMGGFFPSSFSESVIPYSCLAIVLMSVSFGLMSDKIRGVRGVYEALTSGTSRLGGLLLIYILVMQLYHSYFFVVSHFWTIFAQD